MHLQHVLVAQPALPLQLHGQRVFGAGTVLLSLGMTCLSRSELEQILWHCDTAEKAGETPRLHSVLVDGKVQLLESRNKTLKHDLERTKMLEEAARRKLEDALGQSQPYSYHGLGQRSSRKEQAVDTYEPNPLLL